MTYLLLWLLASCVFCCFVWPWILSFRGDEDELHSYRDDQA